MVRKTVFLKVFLQIFLMITLTFFISNAYAEEDVEGTASCCKLTKTGEYCLDASPLECVEGSFIEGIACENIESCSAPKGCCEMPQSNCQDSVLELVCNAEGGVFNDKSCDSVSQCIETGCMIGSQCNLKTAYECEKEGGEVRKDITSWEQCNQETNSVLDGCCAAEAGCSYGNLAGCYGDAYPDTFCSQVEQCDLEARDHMDCGTGDLKDNVYWYDSNGNMEELVAECNPIISGALGTTACGDTDEDGYGDSCVSLDCEDTWDNSILDGDGGKRANGEFWCEYQSAVGPGLDLPGTAHYLHSCERGVEKVALCSEDRSEICVYGQVVAEDASFDIAVAECVTNGAAESDVCLQANDKEDPDLSCDEYPGCVWLGERGTAIEPLQVEVQIEVEEVENPVLTYLIVYSEEGDEIFRNNFEGKEVLEDEENYNIRVDLLPGYYDLALENVATGEVTMKEDVDVSLPEGLEAASGVCAPLVKSTTFFDRKSNDDLCAGVGKKYDNVAVWSRKYFGDWKCKKGCDVYSSDFMVGTNQMCNFYADCGVGYNVEGELYEDGYHRECQSDREFYNDDDLSDECKTRDWEEFYESFNFNEFNDAKNGLNFGELSVPLGVGTQDSNQFQYDDVWGLAWSGASDVLLDFEGHYGANLIYGSILLIAGSIGALIGTAFHAVGDLVTGNWHKDRKKDIEFTCTSWKAPLGGLDCDKCHTPQSDGGLMPDIDGEILEGYTCTKALCNSLGQGCELLDPMNGDQPQCLYRPSLNDNDPGPRLRLHKEEIICNQNGPGVVGACEVKEEGNVLLIEDLVDEYGQVNLTLESYHPVTGNLELADCRSGFAGSMDYAQMLPFGDQRAFEHNLFLDNSDWKAESSVEIYIKCVNDYGVESTDNYVVRFEVAPESDIEPPFVSKVIPEEGYVPFGEDSMKVKLIIDNDALQDSKDQGCVWSRDEITLFTEVNSNMECSGLGMGSMSECTGKLDFDDELGLENVFYFACQDDDLNTRGGQPDGGYVVRRSPELLIEDIKCPHFENDECAGDIYENKIDLSFVTVGGAKEGKAVCELGINEYGLYTINEEASELHIQTGFEPREGENKLFIECADGYGNVAKTDVSFNHIADKTQPEVKKVYVENQNFKIITNEYSDCKSLGSDLDFETGVLFTTDNFHLEHTMTYVEDSYFMVECRDRFGNSVGPFDAQVIKG